jgi:hypothetical protein
MIWDHLLKLTVISPDCFSEWSPLVVFCLILFCKNLQVIPSQTPVSHVRPMIYIHTYIPLALYPRRGIKGIANAIHALVAFYDIHGRKREVLFFYLVPVTTRDSNHYVLYYYILSLSLFTLFAFFSNNAKISFLTIAVLTELSMCHSCVATFDWSPASSTCSVLLSVLLTLVLRFLAMLLQLAQFLWSVSTF